MDERSRFVELVRDLPLISVDLVLVRDGREVLLGLRTNRPAQGSWFVPGGRILKNERRADALTRVAARELGIPDIHALAQHLIGQGGQALGVDIAGGDARALGQKRLDDGAADAGGAGGHDDAVSAQIQIHLTLPL